MASGFMGIGPRIVAPGMPGLPAPGHDHGGASSIARDASPSSGIARLTPGIRLPMTFGKNRLPTLTAASPQLKPGGGLPPHLGPRKAGPLSPNGVSLKGFSVEVPPV